MSSLYTTRYYLLGKISPRPAPKIPARGASENPSHCHISLLIVPLNRSMQADFKATHKEVDQIRTTDLRPGELRGEIGQLEDEKKQLTEKISKLKGNVSDEPGKL